MSCYSFLKLLKSPHWNVFISLIASLYRVTLKNCLTEKDTSLELKPDEIFAIYLWQKKKSITSVILVILLSVHSLGFKKWTLWTLCFSFTLCTKNDAAEGPLWAEYIVPLVTITQLLPGKPCPLCIQFKAEMCKLLCSGNKYVLGKR